MTPRRALAGLAFRGSLWGSVWVLVLGACGGASFEVGTPDGGGADAAPTDGPATSDAAAGCPAALPTAGGACAPAGLVCEFGTIADPRCNTLATCSGGQWTLTQPQPLPTGQCNPPHLPPVNVTKGCPATFLAVPINDACPMAQLLCDYPEARCECAPPSGPAIVDGSATPTWLCEDPAGCLAPRPRLGTPCSTDKQSCDYGACTIIGGVLQTCTHGVWVQTPPLCPKSAG